jgi:plasminogen activator
MSLFRSINVIVCLLLTLSTLLFPTESETNLLNYPNLRLEAGISMSILNGESRETVYDTDQDRRKISELFWDLKEVPLLGFHLRSEIFDDFRVDCNAQFNVEEGNGIMTDWDWMHPTSPEIWTSFSQHSVDVTKARIYDVNMSYSFYKFKEGRGKVRAIMGYKTLFWEWEDHVEFLVYSSNAGGGGLRDIFTPGSGERGIDYQQHFSIPYLGIGTEFPYDPFYFDLQLIYSHMVFAKDRDYHILRDLLFEEKSNNGEYYSLIAEVKWNFTKDWFLGLKANYERVKEIRTDIIITVDPFPHLIIPNAAGIAYDSYQVGLTLSKKI